MSYGFSDCAPALLCVCYMHDYNVGEVAGKGKLGCTVFVSNYFDVVCL